MNSNDSDHQLVENAVQAKLQEMIDNLRKEIELDYKLEQAVNNDKSHVGLMSKNI